MIISHKYKFLFIGLPFSASSAISKELHAKYEGLTYLRKHSLYHEFRRVATNKEKEYFVFAVLRNPMEIAITVYEKMKTNAKGNFTNPNLFQENGGHITKNQLLKFNFIRRKRATFQEYFLKFHTKPYDNLSSITLDKCDFIIRYEKIAEDYLIALKKVGVENPSQLPVANKTTSKKKDLGGYYTEDIKQQAIHVFGPFLKKYNYSFPQDWGKVKTPLISKIQFKIMGFLRKMNEKCFKKYSSRKSIEGSIYGDMQRKRKSQ